MNPVTLLETKEEIKVTIDDIIAALNRVPTERLPDVLQFIEFVEYQSVIDDSSEDEALWAAVEAEQAYRREHPEDIITLRSAEDLQAFLDSDE